MTVAAPRVPLCLGDFCDREGVGLVLTSPADLELAPETISQPDVFVVPLELLPDATGDAPDWHVVTALHLAIEVISPGSARFDRVDKREHYLDAKVAEYWVVDVEGRAIERWRQGRDTPAVERDRLEWRPAAWAGEPTGDAPRALSIDVQQFFELIARKLRRPR